jgi:hypothetical protein
MLTQITLNEKHTAAVIEVSPFNELNNKLFDLECLALSSTLCGGWVGSNIVFLKTLCANTPD